MAGRRVYGGSNMVVIMQNEVVSPETIEALLASGASADFHASRSMVSFEDGGGSTPESSLYRQVDQEDAGMDDPDEFHQPEKKRRLTVDQVQFLERSFEMENKLEPERKAQLAKDLGLQPRQVAIWFQNRRARWKTKQIEKDYETLKCSYNSLRSDYENLLKDKERLKAEVMVLTEKVLLKDGEDNPRAQEPLTPPQQRPRAADPGGATNVGKTELFPAFSCKMEDTSSANSALLDSDSSHRSDEFSPRFNSPNAFEQDHSDLSHTEDEGEMYRFPKLEDGSCHYGFHVEDQDLWFWPSY